jgi:hypothetical protein
VADFRPDGCYQHIVGPTNRDCQSALAGGFRSLPSKAGVRFDSERGYLCAFTRRRLYHRFLGSAKPFQAKERLFLRDYLCFFDVTHLWAKYLRLYLRWRKTPVACLRKPVANSPQACIIR